MIPTLVLLLGGAGCDYPQDAAGTLDRIRQEHVLRVGVGERPPWITIRNGNASGIEARLVRSWASQLNAKVDWIEGTESALVKALVERQIDMIVAGLTKRSPLLKHAAPTQPCFHVSVVVAAPSGASVGRTISKRVIAYARERPDFAAMVAAKGAKPRPVAHVRGHVSAVYAFEADALGLTPSGAVLEREDLVMLVARGESAFLLRLDRFLARTCASAIQDYLNETG